jgi:esterase/lipase superfamily enzyme
MKYRLAPVAGSFVVLDASKIDVGRAALLLRTRGISWFVLQQDHTYFVLSSSELRRMLERKRTVSLLSETLKLDRVAPSHVFSSAGEVIELAQKPDKAMPSGRAVFLRKNASRGPAIFAVGTLASAVAVKVKLKPVTARSGFKSAPGRPIVDRARGGRAGKSNTRMGRGAPAKKAAAKRAPAKKAAKKAAPGGPGRFRGVDTPPRSFSLGFGTGPSGGTAKPKADKPVSPAEVIDVFFATDREAKTATPNGVVSGFLNRLPEKVELGYGVCHVSVPRKHSLGKIESPSVWTFWGKADPQKHFTITGYESRTLSTFTNELQTRVGQNEGKSCFVFIHGYNVSFDDAALRTAQLACDLKFLGVPILYSWASANDPRRYSKDEDTVGLTVKRLTAFLSKLIQASGAEQIHLIAHSMGNRALVNALDRLAVAPNPEKKPFKQVVLTAPDVARKDVESLIQAASDKAERVTLYASSKDKALGLSRVKHDYERLGKVYGYPFVLEGMDSIDASKVKTDFWGHGVFATTRTVLGDLSALIADGKPPNKRFGLRALKSPSGAAWAIEP